jgi:hypothetical protein
MNPADVEDGGPADTEAAKERDVCFGRMQDEWV